MFKDGKQTACRTKGELRIFILAVMSFYYTYSWSIPSSDTHGWFRFLLITRGQTRQNIVVKYANLLIIYNQSGSWNSSILKMFISLLFSLKIFTPVNTCKFCFKTIKDKSLLTSNTSSKLYGSTFIKLRNAPVSGFINLQSVC